MGRVYADIELVSLEDLFALRKGVIQKDEVKKLTVRMMVDSGADYLAITENIKIQLDLPVVETKIFSLADGSEAEYEIVGPVKVKFANRQTNCDAVVLPNGAEPLLGAIPMEGMDVLIHPRTQQLSVPDERPYVAGHYLK